MATRVDPVTTREEHLAWCKQRALVYVERGELVNALASFSGDIMKWEGSPGESIVGRAGDFLLALEGVRCVQAADRAGMRRLIEGFH